MSSNDDIDFSEFASEFTNPANFSRNQSPYLISSELDPFIRRFEKEPINNLSNVERKRIGDYKIQFENFSKSIGYVTLLEDNVKSFTKIGVFLYHMKDFQGARFIFDLILRQYPEDVRSLNNKALCINYKDDTHIALELLDLAISIHPDYFEPRLNKASLLLDNNNIEGLSILKELLAKFPNRQRSTLLSLLTGLSRLGDLNQFMEYYKQAEEKNLVDTEFELRLAEAYFNNEKYSESEIVYKKILLDSPDNRTAALNKVSCLIQQELPNTALVALRFLEKKMKKDPDYLGHLAAANYFLKRTDMAIVLGLKSIEFCNKDYSIFNFMGLFYSEREDYEEGIVYYDKALSIRKDCYFALGNKSNNLMFQRKLSQALDVMKTFDRYKPNEPIILNNIKAVEQEISNRNSWPEAFR